MEDPNTLAKKPYLRIGIDGSRLDSSFTGINKYIFQLCSELNKFNFPANFFVYSRKPIDLPFSSNWQNRTETNPLFAKLPRSIWLKMRCARYAKQDKIDLFWATSSIYPVLEKDVRVVNTIYDLNHLFAPETMPFLTRLTHKLWLKKDLLRADALITISGGTAAKIRKHFGRDAHAIVTPAISPLYRPAEKKIVDKCLNNYGIKRKYLLAVATMEPRKNLLRLVKAYTKLKANKQLEGFSLVLVGLKGWGGKSTLEKLIQLDNSIKPLGYVPEENLPYLYTGAALFVFPSLYEGFGMPVLEARACGTRVVASDIPEIREAGEDKAIYVNPSLQEDIEQGILKSLHTPRPEPADLTEKYSWHNSAQKLLKVFIELSDK